MHSSRKFITSFLCLTSLCSFSCCTKMIQALTFSFSSGVGSGMAGTKKDGKSDKKSTALAKSEASSLLEVKNYAKNCACIRVFISVAITKYLTHIGRNFFRAQSCKRLWNAMKIILSMFIHELWRQKNAKFCKWSRDINFHIDDFTRRCHSRLLLCTLKQTAFLMRVETLKAKTNDATYTRPPKQQNHNYDALKHAEESNKALLLCVKAKCVSSELSNYCRVCFSVRQFFRTNFKDSFSLSALTFVFFLRRVGTKRVDEPPPTNTNSDDNIIPLISSKTLIVRAKNSVSYLFTSAAKAAAAKTVNEKHQKLWGKVTHTSAGLKLASPSTLNGRVKTKTELGQTSCSRWQFGGDCRKGRLIW